MISDKDGYLYFDFTDTEMNIIENLRALIKVRWDSNYMKLQLENLIKEFDEINKEIIEVEEQRTLSREHD